jgi:hypothetical protein
VFRPTGLLIEFFSVLMMSRHVSHRVIRRNGHLMMSCCCYRGKNRPFLMKSCLNVRV